MHHIKQELSRWWRWRRFTTQEKAFNYRLEEMHKMTVCVSAATFAAHENRSLEEEINSTSYGWFYYDSPTSF